MSTSYYTQVFLATSIQETKIEIEWKSNRFDPKTGKKEEPKEHKQKYYALFDKNKKIIDCLCWKWGEYTSTFIDNHENGSNVYETMMPYFKNKNQNETLLCVNLYCKKNIYYYALDDFKKKKTQAEKVILDILPEAKIDLMMGQYICC